MAASSSSVEVSTVRASTASARLRSAAIASAASAMMPLAAFAITDADIYKRADEGKLNAARVRMQLSI